jgi:ferric-dicitrate binding protein FerR (iron transport regulator)
MQRLASACRRTAAGAASAAVTLVIATLLPLAVPAPATAQPRCAQPAAIVRTIDNEVRVVLASTAAQVPATRDMPVCAGDTIQVAARSRAVVFLTASNTLLALDQNSQLEIAPANVARPSVSLLRGALLFITRLRRAFEVRTPFVNASVEGTEFVVRVGVDRATVTVLEGRVRAANDLGFVDVDAGEQAVATKGQAPQLQVVVRPRDAVQWAIYYEPVLPADTFAALDAVPAASQDAAFFVRRAALLLSVGQLEAARVDLDQAQKLDRGYGEAYAVRAITAVALNDKAQALEAGRRGVELAPSSTAARLALSYALQADFQLEAARDVVSQAVAASPNDASAWARLAELRLMFDDVRGAANAAEGAIARAPALARGQMVLGFVRLAQLRFSDGRQAFEDAIRLGSSDPLARIGLALVKIRRGHLLDGISDLELAAALNPDNAIVRSYLGNAYLEDKRETLAEEQFRVAKQLDAQDPTPWLYSAIQQQTQNRPVAALEDIGESIARNNNRAVYRSRLLLDGDRAVRGAHLGRIYGDLGFEQLALAEGWRSVDGDPSNHAAHRLLADNYLALPSHQIARDSELLQSQLLQPVNLSPVQPRLAYHGLNFLEDVGISRVGHSEFTRLFTGDGIRVVADGLLGAHDTAADNAIASGLFGKLSFSAGQFHYRTDGVRPNHDLRQDIANAFAQVDITEATSVFFEYRRAEEKQGDRSLLFDATFFDPQQRSVGKTAYARVSARHRLSTNGLILGTYARAAVDGVFVAGPFEIANNDTSDFVEVRFLGHSKHANFTAGVGTFRSDGTEELTFDSIAAPPQDLFVRHTNVYGYSTVMLPRAVAVTAGVSGDLFDAWDLGERRQVSPKLGVSWPVTSTTTIRGAVFRVFDRTLVSGQTIEPTHISGFNQFFDDGAGARSWRYGIGVDHRIAQRTYIGAEYSGRDLAVPLIDPFVGSVVDGTVEEHFTRAYVYSTVGPMFAWSLGYQLHKASDPEGSNPWLLQRVTTHRVPAELRVVHGAGLYGRLRVTGVTQDGVFRNAMFELFDGSDESFVTDLSAGYKLPSRWGLVAVDLRNVFDQRFNFQDASPRDPTIVPRRQGFVRLLITF